MTQFNPMAFASRGQRAGVIFSEKCLRQLSIKHWQLSNREHHTVSVNASPSALTSRSISASVLMNGGAS